MEAKGESTGRRLAPGGPGNDSRESDTSLHAGPAWRLNRIGTLASLIKSVKRPEIIAVVAITALAAAIRLRHLGEQSIWIDEATSVTMATMPLRAMWHVVGAHETNMALYYLILRVWVALFGQSETAVRLPSALASIATVPVLYCAGRRMFGTTAGIVAALLLALAPSSALWAQQARGYSMEALGVAGSLLFFMRMLDRPSAGNLAGWTLTVAFAIHCHSLAATIVPAELVVLPLRDVRTLPWRRLGVALAALAVLVGPYLMLLVHIRMPLIHIWRLLVHNRMLLVHNRILLAHNDHGTLTFLGPPSWAGATATLYGMLNGMAPETSGHMMVMASVFGMLLGVVGFVRAWDESRERAIPCALAASGVVVPLALISLESLHDNLLFYRYLIFTTPALCLFIAGGISALRGWRVRSLALLGLVAASAWQTSVTLQFVRAEPWREVASSIKAMGRPGDALVTYSAEDRYALDYNLVRLGVPQGYFVDAYPDWDENFEIDHHYIHDRETQLMFAQHLLDAIDSSSAQGRSLFLVIRRGNGSTGFPGDASIKGIMQRLSSLYAVVKYRGIGDLYVFYFHQSAPSSPPKHGP